MSEPILNQCYVCCSRPAARHLIVSQPINGKLKEERCHACEVCFSNFAKAAVDYPGLKIREVTPEQFAQHPSGFRN